MIVVELPGGRRTYYADGYQWKILDGKVLQVFGGGRELEAFAQGSWSRVRHGTDEEVEARKALQRPGSA